MGLALKQDWDLASIEDRGLKYGWMDNRQLLLEGQGVLTVLNRLGAAVPISSVSRSNPILDLFLFFENVGREGPDGEELESELGTLFEPWLVAGV